MDRCEGGFEGVSAIAARVGGRHGARVLARDGSQVSGCVDHGDLGTGAKSVAVKVDIARCVHRCEFGRPNRDARRWAGHDGCIVESRNGRIARDRGQQTLGVDLAKLVTVLEVNVAGYIAHD